MARNVLYPLYQLGGPQLRVFRTNFFIQLVRPGTVQPEDTVQFRIPMEMTRVDLRNYLERIYNVPVAAVRTRVQHGSNRKRDHRNVRIKKPDYKVAYVQLVSAALASAWPLGTQAPEEGQVFVRRGESRGTSRASAQLAMAGERGLLRLPFHSKRRLPSPDSGSNRNQNV
ncbi:Hypothetical predicted protein [Marmota monax]|uniref:Large ribosomal subunit protein uL23m n=1 Tax=Marmota monax TaxID=9995 RepID=A0A5E4CDI1_MARMO|nr:hypothetical protein GHT09_014970 [Marmota monax]VTJ79775.1 Hypothetical predicted protein [Marmota monax]